MKIEHLARQGHHDITALYALHVIASGANVSPLLHSSRYSINSVYSIKFCFIAECTITFNEGERWSMKGLSGLPSSHFKSKF